jgi:glycosyltransferase involved in cell wall biosynthesis
VFAHQQPCPHWPRAYLTGVDWKSSCAVVIPCLNEAKAVGKVINAVRQFLPNVLVVDDGSTDNTSAVARDAGASVLGHEQPCGKGAALRDGWTEVQRRGFSWALSMDGDGQHAPTDLPRFLERASRGDVALVSGNRMANTAGMPFVRRCTNRFMSGCLSHVAGAPLPDSQCGYRLMRLDAWSQLPVNTSCFEIESEILVQFARARLGIAFVPITVIYGDERSKIRPLRDTVRWFRWLASVRRQGVTAGKR